MNNKNVAEVLSKLFLNESLSGQNPIFSQEIFSALVRDCSIEDIAAATSRYTTLSTSFISELPNKLRGQKALTYTLGGHGSERGRLLSQHFNISVLDLGTPAWQDGYYADKNGHFQSLAKLQSVYARGREVEGISYKKVEDYKDKPESEIDKLHARAKAINFALLNDAAGLGVPILLRSTGLETESHIILNALSDRGYSRKLLIIDRPLDDKLTSDISQTFKIFGMNQNEYARLVEAEHDAMDEQLESHICFSDEISIYWQGTQDDGPKEVMRFEPEIGWGIFDMRGADSFMNSRNYDPRDLKDTDGRCEDVEPLSDGLKSFIP